jgi:hypothetical protein
MKQVRPAVKSDIPQVTELFQKAFFNNSKAAPTSSKLNAYFEEFFFQNPAAEEEITSLVYEASDGKIIGFIGITPRRMLLRGQPIRAAISMHFMVDPGSRSTLAGVQLLKTFFSGPQDLSLTDGSGNVGRKIWEALGGATALPYSINWLRVLRPGQYVLDRLRRKTGLLRAFALALRPLCPMVDAIVSQVAPHRFGKSVASLQESDLDKETLLAGITQFSAGAALRPDYDQSLLSWLLAKADQSARPGALHKIALRDADGELSGWYIYKLNADGPSEVLQVVGRKWSFGDVLDHLFYHSWRHGATALTGRLVPEFAQEFSDKHCLFNCGHPWTLVYSKNQELLQAIYRCDVFLTKMEGEWCMRFHNERE